MVFNRRPELKQQQATPPAPQAEEPNLTDLQNLRTLIEEAISESRNPARYSCKYCNRLRCDAPDTLCQQCDSAFIDPRTLEIYQLSKRVGWPLFQADSEILKKVPENHEALSDEELKAHYHEHDSVPGYIGNLTRSKQPTRRMNVSPESGVEWYDHNHYPDVFVPDGPQQRRSEVPGTSTAPEREAYEAAELAKNAQEQATRRRASAQRELARLQARAAELEGFLNG